MHRKKNFKKSYIFLTLFFGLVAIGGSYSSWYSNINAEAKFTSGTMDVVFGKHSERYSAGITDASGNLETPVKAEFNSTDRDLQISFDEGLPVNSLLEGKMLKLEFPVTPSKDSTVDKLNHSNLDLSKPGQSVELQAESAELIYKGESYSLGENESTFVQPLQFEVYEILSKENTNDNIGQIYLKLSADSADMIRNFPTKLDIDAEDIDVDADNTDTDADADNTDEMTGESLYKHNGVLVKYSLEIPYDVFQSGSKVNKSSK